MHYAASLEITTTDTITSPAELVVHMGAGVIRKCQLIFPPGCARTVCLVVFKGADQVLPTNPEMYYAEDGQSILIDCYIPLGIADNKITLYGWSDGSTYDHVITAYFDVEGPDEPNLHVLLLSLVDVIQQAIDIVKRWFY